MKLYHLLFIGLLLWLAGLYTFVDTGSCGLPVPHLHIITGDGDLGAHLAAEQTCTLDSELSSHNDVLSYLSLEEHIPPLSVLGLGIYQPNEFPECSRCDQWITCWLPALVNANNLLIAPPLPPPENWLSFYHA